MKKIENMIHCSVWDKYPHTFEQSAAFYGLKEVNYLVQSQTYLVTLNRFGDSGMMVIFYVLWVKTGHIYLIYAHEYFS